MAIGVSPKLGVNTLSEFIALAKRRPNDTLLYGASRLTVPHMTGELLNLRAGIRLWLHPDAGRRQGHAGHHERQPARLRAGERARHGPAPCKTERSRHWRSRPTRRLSNLPGPPAGLRHPARLPGPRGWFVLMAPARNVRRRSCQAGRGPISGRRWSEPALRKRYEQMGTFPRPTSSVEEVLSLIEAEQEPVGVPSCVGSKRTNHGPSHRHYRRRHQRPRLLP